METPKQKWDRARIDMTAAKRRMDRADRAYRKLVVYDPASMPANDRLACAIGERRALEEYCAALTDLVLRIEVCESAYAALVDHVKGGR